MSKERLQKILSRAGIASRRKAEKLVQEGRVQVDGHVVTRLDFKADAMKDHIRVDGRLIKKLEPRTYIILNKPRGVLCTRKDPLDRPVVTDLLKRVRFRLYPVGRLDADSEGVVILTNDGEFFQNMAHPKYQNPRTYRVKVKGVPDSRKIQLLREGMELRDGPTQPAKVTLIKTLKANSWWKVVVREGRNRLVRRMFQKIDHPVLRLQRVKYGSLGLGGLRPGQSRYLNADEINMLLKSRRPMRSGSQRRGRRFDKANDVG